MALKMGMGTARPADGLNHAATPFHHHGELRCPACAIDNRRRVPPSAHILDRIADQQLGFMDFHLDASQTYLSRWFLGLFEAGREHHTIGEALAKKPYCGLGLA
mgnify:CR=1 FL=1